MAAAITFGTALELPASIERLWPFLSDTDRTNRMLGLPASEQILPNPDLSRTIHGHFLGVPVTWREYPFEWIFEQWFEVTRLFEPPFPVDKLITRTTLTPAGPSATRVDVQVIQVPRSPLGGAPARLFVEQKFLRDMRRVYRMLGQIAAEAAEYEPPPPLVRPSVSARRLEQGAARLRGFGVRAELVDHISQHLTSADDPDVLKMRPFALADRWGEPRLETLRAFLHATRSGLVDLEWDVICPACRGTSERLPQLVGLSAAAHCPSCQIRYDVDFEESVELRFSAHPEIRSAQEVTFCSGGPANTRHILAQVWLEPHSARQLRTRLAPGTYRVRTRQLPTSAALRVGGGQGARAAELQLAHTAIAAPEGELAAGEVELTLSSAHDERLLVIIEQSAWNLQAASAALVTSLDEFRQLFSAEVLTPGLGISIRSLTFMFSDLKDSTQIYDQIGDSPAYARVRDHFDIMRAIIASHNGGLVKTIGDAVMAVFRSSEDAIAAAIAIQREFTTGPIGRGNPNLRVKLGLHRGPCIAVNANDLLDYFGSTVNIAARVQSESVGGDIVVTDELLDAGGVRQAIVAAEMLVEPFERSLKGFSRSFPLARLWLRPEDAAAARAG